MTTFIYPFRFSGGIFSFCCFLLLLLSSFSSQSQPQMQWEQTKHNFGAVKRGEVLRKEFLVKNNGTAPLLLQKAEVSCSCTSVELDTAPVMPGQTGKVTIVFNTASVYGRQDRVVEIITNVAGEPVRLRYKALVSQKP
jgi:hypothetical protein